VVDPVNLDNYVDVATRRKIAAELWPDLRIVEARPEIVTVSGDTFVSVTVTVYRTPDDELPTAATAWEAYPGKSSFTRGSEMMNAATSALGRALGYMGVGIGRSIATADEVNTRKADRDTPAKAPVRAVQPRTAPTGTAAPEPEPAPPAGKKRASQPQLAKMNALLIELGAIARADKLQKVIGIVGHPVDSSSDLTTLEASAVIDALEAEAVNARAVAELAAMLPEVGTNA
jgi:hypothetical protein